MKAKLSDDTKMIASVREGLEQTGGYCPCRVEHTDDTMCMCKEFREKTPVGNTCHCGLYIKTEM